MLPYFFSVRLTSSRFGRGFFLPSRYFACTGLSIPGPRLRRRVPTFLSLCGAGISTCCPSATHLCLALGPDSPRAEKLYPGNLGYSAWRIPTSISLLIPAFSLLNAPPLLPVRLHSLKNAPLPMHLMIHPAASAACFSPGHFRRRTSRLVSYYALFECVAASKPTS